MVKYAKVAEMLQAGRSQSETSAALDVNISTVQRVAACLHHQALPAMRTMAWRDKVKVGMAMARSRGVMWGPPPLTDDEVLAKYADVTQLLRDGKTYAEITRATGRCGNTVRAVRAALRRIQQQQQPATDSLPISTNSVIEPPAPTGSPDSVAINFTIDLHDYVKPEAEEPAPSEASTPAPSEASTPAPAEAAPTPAEAYLLKHADIAEQLLKGRTIVTVSRATRHPAWLVWRVMVALQVAGRMHGGSAYCPKRILEQYADVVALLVAGTHMRAIHARTSWSYKTVEQVKHVCLLMGMPVGMRPKGLLEHTNPEAYAARHARIAQLASEKRNTVAHIAQVVGKSCAHVRHVIRVLRLTGKLRSSAEEPPSIPSAPSTSERIISGLAEARRNGVRLGRPKGKTDTAALLDKHSDIVEHVGNGLSIRKTAEATGKGVSTVQRVAAAISTATEKPKQLSDYRQMTDDELRKATQHCHSSKLQSIRAWPYELSPKQRYCLIAWLVKRDKA